MPAPTAGEAGPTRPDYVPGSQRHRPRQAGKRRTDIRNAPALYSDRSEKVAGRRGKRRARTKQAGRATDSFARTRCSAPSGDGATDPFRDSGRDRRRARRVCRTRRAWKSSRRCFGYARCRRPYRARSAACPSGGRRNGSASCRRIPTGYPEAGRCRFRYKSYRRTSMT